MDKIQFDEKKILDALERSGYLLESEISKTLVEAGFFVETNQIIKDPLTNKSREIDLIAEFYDWHKPLTKKCKSNVKFVFEIKNNAAPLVLLTEFQNSINIDDWEGTKEYITIPEGIFYDSHEAYWAPLIKNEKKSIFTQYCSFQEKKQNGELMALHPDNVYEGLQKISQYCQEKCMNGKERIEKANGFFRHFIYVPILLITDDLYELHYEDKKSKLKKVDSSILVYNYHHKKRPTMAYIFVITKKGFPKFMSSMLKLENFVEQKMISIRNSSEKGL